MKLTIAILIAYTIDLIIGDPGWMPHPVVYIGKLIAALEKGIRKVIKADKVGGLVLVILVLLITGTVTYSIIYLAYKVSVYLGLLVETFWMYQIFATKSLKKESMKVYNALDDDLDEGRLAVSYIVGRDTNALDEKGVIKATVETVAENTTDGVIAPIICCAIGGAGLGMIYKAINTMDSMVGYKNEKYINFGTVAAKLDDVVNYLPARIAAGIMIVAAGLGNMNMKNAFKIFKRDRYNHKSPNSAQMESVCAGALGIQLAGNANYFGKLYEKPNIGDKIREIEKDDIKRSIKLMYISSGIALAICIAIRVTIFI
ncbi:MAG: cobalamin biosynthesis protein CobD [Peptostreptococcaceae bacterium]|nr:cobalamin biosynthesis protein CobD [Peptostreptococcaceae bacterium]